ncbi:hypothetical protein BDZ85DRAFT_295747 [Elsinoe ampelina]|uniref:KOW domain-containing protein n=1 Tax=Elsinoe ampelina TaxID=302913 RepID=A0A6A6GCP4_9PEZI|nr:hypothetical protein BDZ85DRAFT_295747 [Elsinoe ampelina]
MQAPLQRITGRVIRATSNASKKRKKAELEKYKDERFSYRVSRDARDQEIKSQYRMERQFRKADWEYGTRLLPRRDIGIKRTTFGTVDRNLDANPVVPEKWRKPTFVAAGDRVVVLKGVDRGKIGKVREVHEDRQEIDLEDLNQYNFTVPDFVAEGDQQEYLPTVYGPRPVKFEDIKLVTRVKDRSGLVRDVVVKEFEIRKSWHRGADVRGQRWIPGLEKRIRWPEQEKEPEDVQDTDSDTFRLTVDEPTFTPTLQRPPMPPSVIDELRGKYSKFRTRHEPEWLAQKQDEATAVQGRKQRLEALGMTPMQKASAQHKASKSTAKALSDERLASLGEAILKARRSGRTTATTS